MATGASLLFSLLLSLALAVSATTRLKSGAFYSPTFDMTPGAVVFDYFYDVDFPRGHLAVKTFRADVVDEDDNIIPFHEVYLHHSSMSRYYQARNYSIPPVLNTETLPYGDGFIYRRNHGICQGDILGQYLGLGTEMLSTPYNVPDPYGIEIGDPALIPDGFDEKWLLMLHAIDTRGAVDRIGCTECRRDLYNVSVDGFGRELDQFGQPLRADYYGGLSCCYAHTRCKVREGYHGPTRRLRLRYTLTWTEWVPSIVPVRVYIVDITDDMKFDVHPFTGAVRAQHDCAIEYMVESCHVNGEKKGVEEGCVHLKKSIAWMPKGGNVIFGLTHLHSGAINSTLYGQDGRVVCKTEPMYGEGEEEGYIVGVSTCNPDPGSVWINDGELLVQESVYTADRRRTGVMGVFYLLVADREVAPNNNPAAAATNFLRLRSLLADQKYLTDGGVMTSTTGALMGVGILVLVAAVLLLLLGN